MKNDVMIAQASIAQKALWLSSKKHSAKANCVPVLWEVNGTLRDELLEQALLKLISRHVCLRLGFKFENDQVYQYEQEVSSIPFSAIKGQTSDVDVAMKQASFFEFDLEQPPLVKLTKIVIDNQKSILVFCFHHIVCDARSIKLYIEDFGKYYNSLELGNQPDLSEVKFNYIDYSNWENSCEIEAEKQANLEKWSSYLHGYNNVPLFSKAQNIPERGKNSETFPFIDIDCQALTSISSEYRTTRFIYFASTIALLLHKYSQEEKLIIYFPVSTRDDENLFNISGPLVNTLALTIEVKGTKSFSQILDQVKKSLLLALDAKLVSLESVYQHVKEQDNRDTLSVLFMYNYSGGIELDINGCITKQTDCYSANPKFALVFDFVERSQNIVASLEFDTALIDRFLAKSIGNSLQEIVKQTLATPDLLVSTIELSKLSHLPARSNKPSLNIAIQDILANLSNSEQDGEVLVSSSLSSYNARKTLQKVCFFQNQLYDLNVEHGDYILVSIGRRVEIVPLILSIMSIGAVYVPIDQNILSHQLEHIIKQTQCSFIICDESTSKKFADCDQVLNIDEIGKNELANACLYNYVIRPTDIAYCFFTSGTTGVPKGVKITHRNLTSFILAMSDVIEMNQEDTMGALTSFNFDISLLELLMPLYEQSHVHIITEEERRSSIELAHAVQKYNISILQATPTFWKIIDLIPSNCSLKVAISGGEPIAPEVIQKMNAISEKSLNCYGPTEATIWATALDCSNWKNKSISVGAPLKNSGVVILGKDLEMVPEGTVGEVYLYGQGVGEGYLRNNQQTEKAFIYSVSLGTTIYKTGDRGRINPNQELDIIGRCDNQVKINGHRVELEDIEFAISNHPDVIQAVATIRNNELQASIVVSSPQVSIGDISAFLRATYPQHYAPQKWLQVDSMPLLSSGKIDRKTIAGWLHKSNTIGQEKTEKFQLHEVLINFIKSVDIIDSVSEIDIDADLTQLGFDSVLFIILIETIRAELGKILDFNDLLSGITLRELSLKVSL